MSGTKSIRLSRTAHQAGGLAAVIADLPQNCFEISGTDTSRKRQDRMDGHHFVAIVDMSD